MWSLVATLSMVCFSYKVYMERNFVNYSEYCFTAMVYHQTTDFIALKTQLPCFRIDGNGFWIVLVEHICTHNLICPTTVSLKMFTKLDSSIQFWEI